MKKYCKVIISIILSLALFSSMSMSAAAEAESLLDKLNKQLEETKNAPEENSSDSLIEDAGTSVNLYASNWFHGEFPSEDDIIATGDDAFIKMPHESYYLDEYEYKYVVNKDGGSTVFVFDNPSADYECNTHSPLAYNGSLVIVLAVRQIHSCILYRDHNNILHAGWICSENLQDNFPGDKYSVGKDISNTYSKDLINFVPSVWWSEETAADTRTNYTIVENLGKQCISLTIDYQVIGRNGVYKPHEGRRVYCLANGSWIKAGEFNVQESLDPVQFTIHFKKPVCVDAFFIIPTELYKQDIEARQTVVAMCCPES